MSHWASKYIGQPWAKDCNCYGWFRRISKEQFGRDLPEIVFPMDGRLDGYAPTDDPEEGDAVFISGNNGGNDGTFKHMGMVLKIDGKIHFLHAVRDAGVVLSDCSGLRLNGMTIKGFWTYANPPRT